MTRPPDPRPTHFRTMARPHWLAAAVPLVLLVGLWLLTRDTTTLMAQETPLKPAAIDGNRAYRYLNQICDIGPRPAGSEANARQREMVKKHFEATGAKITEQAFKGTDPRTRKPVELVNLIGSWNPDRKQRVLICAHYDTRPHADEETDITRYRQPFIGANDGGSGVALMMEIANHLETLDTPWGVDLVLLDAEELVYGKGSDHSQYFLGSRAFARAYAQGRRSGKVPYRYVAGILLDMVGGKNLRIEREPYSLQAAPWLVEEVWSVAESLKEPTFTRAVGREVYDDHWPLNEGGIPTIDLIDFDYPHWHRITDTPAECAATSLASVGRVVTAWLTLPRESAKP